MITNCSYHNPVYWSNVNFRLDPLTSSTQSVNAPHFKFASSTCETVGELNVSSTQQLTISSSSLPSVANGFTHGEVVATVFLFLIFITLVYRFVFEWVHGIRVRPANKNL